LTRVSFMVKIIVVGVGSWVDSYMVMVMLAITPLPSMQILVTLTVISMAGD